MESCTLLNLTDHRHTQTLLTAISTS